MTSVFAFIYCHILFKLFKMYFFPSQMWWYKLPVLALRSLRQEDQLFEITWSTHWVAGSPRLHSETLSKQTKKDVHFLHFNNSRINTCLNCCYNLLAITSILVVYKMPPINGWYLSLWIREFYLLLGFLSLGLMSGLFAHFKLFRTAFYK